MSAVMLWVAAIALANAAPPLEIVATLEPEGGIQRAQLVLPGSVVELRAPRRGEADESLWVLLRTLDPPRDGARRRQACDDPATTAAGLSLWRVETRGGTVPPVARRVVDGLPADAGGLDLVDLDGDGQREPFLARPGSLIRVRLEDGGTAVAETILADAELHGNAWRSAQAADGSLFVSLPSLRHARFLRGTSEGWTDVAEVPTRVEAELEDRGFRLRSHPPVPLGDDGAVRFVTAPVPAGYYRLRGLLIEPQAGAGATTEWWTRFPAPEEVLSSQFLVFDDRPVLLVLTRPAQKLSLFGEKRLRLFHLEADRSRTGHAPFFEIETRINFWQTSRPFVLDVDGDGRRDLVFGYWKGLIGDKFVLDAYVRDEDGELRRSPRTTSFGVKKGDRDYAAFGGDLNGDGQADLLLQARGKLLVYLASDAKGGKNLVASRPMHEIPLARDTDRGDRPDKPVEELTEEEIEALRVEVESAKADDRFGDPGPARRPRMVRLAGDDRHRVLFARGTKDGTRLTLLRLEADSP